MYQRSSSNRDPDSSLFDSDDENADLLAALALSRDEVQRVLES